MRVSVSRGNIAGTHFGPRITDTISGATLDMPQSIGNDTKASTRTPVKSAEVTCRKSCCMRENAGNAIWLMTPARR